MTDLVFPATAVETLQNHLIQTDQQERAALCYCGKSNDRYLVSELQLIADEDLSGQSRTGCRVEPEVEIDHVNRCTKQGKHLLYLHSHAFEADAEFSAADHRLMPKIGRWITTLYPEHEALFGVFATDSIQAARYNPEAGELSTLSVEIVGGWRLDNTMSSKTYADDGSVPDEERYSRNILTFTEQGQQRLASTRVVVVGAGGLGSLMTTQLARLGVQDLVIVDPDVVEESNLTRLEGATVNDLGQPKVEVLKTYVEQINPAISVTACQQRVQTAADIIRSGDVLIAGVDTMAARMWLNEFSVQHLIPYIDAGVIIEQTDGHVDAMRGFIQTIAPGATGCLKCLNRYNPEQASIDRLSDAELEETLDRGYIEATTLSPEPAVIPLNGVIASKAAATLTHLVTNITEPADFVQYEGLENELVELRTQPHDSCTVCGTTLLGQGETIPETKFNSADVDLLDVNAQLSPADDKQFDRSLMAPDNRGSSCPGSK